jgi:hypothetical protein
MSDPVSAAPGFHDIAQHLTYFGQGELTAGPFYEKTMQLLVKKGDRDSYSWAINKKRFEAAAIVGATLYVRGPSTSGSHFKIILPKAHDSIVPGNTGVADAKGQVSDARVEALIKDVDANHDGKITLAEMKARVNRDGHNDKEKSDGGKVWTALFDMTTTAFNQTSPDGPYITYDQLRNLYNGKLFSDISKANGY